MPTVFITGAGSGMGRAGALLFHRNGWRVGAVDRDESGLRTLADELGTDRLWTRAVDVTDRSALEAALADFCSGNRGGGLDMMWNNAGIGESGWFEDVPFDAAMRVVDVNLRAVIAGAYAALPYLRRNANSLLFSTSSSSATYGMPRIAVYSATKHAVKGLTEALSIEWRRHGVRVADVLPGLIDTAILRSTPDHSHGGATQTHAQIQQAAPRRGPFRLMPADSVAEAALAAYRHPSRLHWYVPGSIRILDRLTAISAEFVRARLVRALPGPR
jgi:NAD(P)-dependent dehydrogenase (short-subunit alcohol dehydrogenase family)